MALGMPQVPEGGLCLSAFLVITDTQNPNSVLMGNLNPKAPWDHIGALDPARIEAHSKGWMLPSSHLIVYESPHDAAKRILKEQLELDNLKLSEPTVISETYLPKRFPNMPHHWDIEFIFKGQIDKDQMPKPQAWLRLDLVNLSFTSKAEIARSHEDILESVGLAFRHQ